MTSAPRRVQSGATAVVDGMPRAARLLVPAAQVVERAGLASAVRSAVLRVDRGFGGPGPLCGPGPSGEGGPR